MKQSLRKTKIKLGNSYEFPEYPQEINRVTSTPFDFLLAKDENQFPTIKGDVSSRFGGTYIKFPLLKGG